MTKSTKRKRKTKADRRKPEKVTLAKLVGHIRERGGITGDELERFLENPGKPDTPTADERRLAKATEKTLRKCRERERAIYSLREGVRIWFFTTRDAVRKLLASVEQIWLELGAEPGGLLAEIVRPHEVDTLYSALGATREALDELEIRHQLQGDFFLYTPTGKPAAKGKAVKS
jgi:hypothetical protein